MPLRPLAIGFALICLAVALLLVALIVRGLGHRRRLALLLAVPALGLIVLASLPVPYILGLDAPHPVFNGPAPVPASAVVHYLSRPFGNESLQNGSRPPLLLAVRAATGKSLWQRELPSPDTYITHGDAASFYATSFYADSTQRSTQLFAFDDATGALLWQRTLPGTTVSSAPLLAGGKLLLGAAITGSPGQKGILALRATDGQQLWSATVGPYDVVSADTQQLVPGPDSSVLYDMPYASILEARTIGDGSLLWVKTQLDGQVVIGPNAIYELPQYDSMAAFSGAALAAQTGAPPLWRFGAHDFFHAGAVVGDTLYVTAQHDGTTTDGAGKLVNPETVYALDAHTGALRWTFATQSANFGELAATPDAVFIRADDGIHALRPADGAVLWSSPARANWYVSAILGSVVYFTAIQTLPPETLTATTQGQVYLYAVNATDGSLYWSVPVGPVHTLYPHYVI